MTDKNDGGAAFPREDYQTEDAPGQRGMSLRDWFAGQALTAFTLGLVGLDRDAKAPSSFAKAAYEYADAMIKERTK